MEICLSNQKENLQKKNGSSQNSHLKAASKSKSNPTEPIDKIPNFRVETIYLKLLQKVVFYVSLGNFPINDNWIGI